MLGEGLASHKFVEHTFVLSKTPVSCDFFQVKSYEKGRCSRRSRGAEGGKEEVGERGRKKSAARKPAEVGEIETLIRVMKNWT